MEKEISDRLTIKRMKKIRSFGISFAIGMVLLSAVLFLKK